MYPQLPEKNIQDIALDFLKRRYRKYSSNGKVAADGQQLNRRNRKEADGLIAFHQGRTEIFTASLEVKKDLSSPAINLVFDEGRGNTLAIIGAGVVYIALITYIHLYFSPQTFDSLWGWASYLLLLSFFFPLRAWIRRLSHPWLKNIGALQQLAQYPGNECWLAIGYYEKSFRHPKLLLLEKWCRRKGVGLLLVRPYSRRQVRVQINPGYKDSPTSASFLDHYYLQAKKFRQQIESKSHNPLHPLFRTPGQWAFRFKFYISPVMLALTLIPFLGKYKGTVPSFASRAAPSVHEALPSNVAPPNETESKHENTIPCSPLPFRGERFLLADSMHKSLQEAEKRVAHLRDFQLQAGYFWLPCIQSNKTAAAYCVYAGQPYTQHQKAIYELKAYRFNLLRKGLEEIQQPFVLEARQ